MYSIQSISRIILPFVWLALAAVLVTSGCAEEGSSGPPGTWVTSERERVTAAAPTAPDLDALQDGNMRFAADAYRVLSEGSDNLVFSPISMSLALAMAYGGARGQTEAQIAEALHFTLPGDQLHAAFNWLEASLSRRELADEDLRLQLINASFGQQGHTFQDAYLDLLAENYGTGMAHMDFAADPEASRRAINDWIADQTAQRIPALLPPGSIASDTVLALASALYFKASWKWPFSLRLTTRATFHAPGGGVLVDMMQGRLREMWHAAGDGYQAVALAYQGAPLDMVLILPDEGSFEAFEASLDGEVLSDVLGALQQTTGIYLELPRFGFSSDTDMKAALYELGMMDAFSSAADFSGVTGKRDLLVSDARHQAFISVNEIGTEAAAASVLVEMPVSAVPTVRFDRPFLFLVRDIETGAILFLGRVTNPAA
jgi:serpin B